MDRVRKRGQVDENRSVYIKSVWFSFTSPPRQGSWCHYVCSNMHPTKQPSKPANQQTSKPAYQHTNIPTYQHTNIPTYQHTNIPTDQQTNRPTDQQTNRPTPTFHKRKEK